MCSRFSELWRWTAAPMDQSVVMIHRHIICIIMTGKKGERTDRERLTEI